MTEESGRENQQEENGQEEVDRSISATAVQDSTDLRAGVESGKGKSKDESKVKLESDPSEKEIEFDQQVEGGLVKYNNLTEEIESKEAVRETVREAVSLKETDNGLPEHQHLALENTIGLSTSEEDHNCDQETEPEVFLDGNEDESTGENHTLMTTFSHPVQSLFLDHISSYKIFFTRPYFKPIVFQNTESESRDLDANERNYLSMLRVSIYLGLAGCVVLSSFRLGADETGSSSSFNFNNVSSRASLPIGILFLILSFLGVFISFHNYVHTIGGYAKQKVVVTTTHSAMLLVIFTGALLIVSNVIFFTE
jgi:uncharacterized membrane protein YidH (DUF202 family)